MSQYQNKYRIESARLKCWDYTTPWWYFITICTKDHIEYFGEIVNSQMRLNEIGKIAEEELLRTTELRDYVEFDEFVIMPNHIHSIIILNDDNRRDVLQNVSTDETNKSFFSTISPKRGSLSVVIRSFKSAVTKSVKEYGFNDFQWQPRFYDRVIRNEKELYNIRIYIQQNPLKWEQDKDIPENLEI